MLVYIINLFFVKRLPKYFFRWRVVAKDPHPNVYRRFYGKYLQVSKILNKKVNSMKNLCKRAMYFWNMQCKHRVPKYGKDDIGRKALDKILLVTYLRQRRQNQKLQKSKDRDFTRDMFNPPNLRADNVQDTKKIMAKEDTSIVKNRYQLNKDSVITIAMKLENAFTEIIEPKMRKLKQFVIDRFRILYQLELSIMNSQKYLFLRTLRVHEKRYFEYFDAVKKVEIKPNELLQILLGRDANKRKLIEQEIKQAMGVPTYLHQFLGQIKLSIESKRSAADLLLGGVWKDKRPYLRVRDLFLYRALKTNLNAVSKTVLQVWANYKDRVNMRTKMKAVFQKKNKDFKRIWGGMYIKMICIDRVYVFNDAIYQVLELNRRISQMVEEINQLKSSQIVPDENRRQTTLIEGRLIFKQVKEALTAKYQLIRADFANGFLAILLDTTLTKPEVRDKLNLYVLKTLSKLFAEGFEQIEQKKPEELAMEREKERLRKEQEERERLLIEQRMAEVDAAKDEEPNTKKV